MKIPPPLQKGDHVCIIAPSGKIKREIVEKGAELLQKYGFVVQLGKHVFDEDGIFAGSDADRASDFQKSLDNKKIRAIFCARGGYGSLRIHSLLNWSAFLKKPKWLIGFSDITVFHSYLSNHGISSIHGVMPAFFQKEGEETQSFHQLLQLLHHPVMDCHLESHPLNRNGEADGVLTGGNLSILYSLRGTSLDISPKGKILFIEDLAEYYYHLDRMLMNLKTGRILEKISGLIVGQFTEMKNGETSFGKEAYEIIKEAVQGYHFPVLFNFPGGHQLPNWPLIFGERVHLSVTERGASIESIKR